MTSLNNLFSKQLNITNAVLIIFAFLIGLFVHGLNMWLHMSIPISFVLSIAILLVVWELFAKKVINLVSSNSDKKTDELLYGIGKICEFCGKPMNFNNPVHTDACIEYYKKKAQNKK